MLPQNKVPTPSSKLYNVKLSNESAHHKVQFILMQM